MSITYSVLKCCYKYMSFNMASNLLRNQSKVLCYQQLASITISSKLGKDYYDLLEITHKATKAQIKDAYYKLSLIHHPDLSKGGEEELLKFREITEAYDVLSNFEKRRLYDKGILGIHVAASPEEAKKYAEEIIKSRGTGKYAPKTTGHTAIFNFDEWSKLHYTVNFERRIKAKVEASNLEAVEEAKVIESKRTIAVSLILFIVALIYILGINFSVSDDTKVKEN